MIDNSIDASAVERAFSKQAISFDDLEKENPILIWMRTQVHNHCMKYYKPGENILELNSGTGIDAVFFAELGLNVLATDISESMLNQLQKKISQKNLGAKIFVQQCSFENLKQFKVSNIQHPTSNFSNRSPLDKPHTFHHILSNFGGLNCTNDLKKVIGQFDSLLNIGGTVTIVVMPKVCPWEILLALKGNFKTAFRRFNKNGSVSHLEDEYFTTYYYNPSEVIKMFNTNFRKVELQGLSACSPPPYLSEWAKRHPDLYKKLTSLDENLSHTFPFNCWADHFILTMKKIA